MSPFLTTVTAGHTRVQRSDVTLFDTGKQPFDRFVELLRDL